MKRLIIPIMIMAFAICGAFTIMHEDLHAAMQKMMQKMKSLKMTGDPDKDFAMMMIEHHQGAIDAANIVVKYGKDPKIKELAQKMLQTQPQDQKELRKHSMGHDQNHAKHNSASGPSASSNSSQFTSDMNNLLDEMEAKMKNMTMSGNIDHDFATTMIGHHQAAIDLADIENQQGQLSEVKLLADKIKKDSKKDIDELQNWLNVHAKK